MHVHVRQYLNIEEMKVDKTGLNQQLILHHTEEKQLQFRKIYLVKSSTLANYM